MNTQPSTDANLQSLMKMLESKDGLVRQKARIALVEMGDPAVIPLSEALKHSKLDHTRWGAAKALGEIVDVRSIPALVHALDDTDADVAWLAGVALKKVEKAAWRILLSSRWARAISLWLPSLPASATFSAAATTLLDREIAWERRSSSESPRSMVSAKTLDTLSISSWAMDKMLSVAL